MPEQFAEQIHEPEELEPRCPRCDARLDTYVRCRACGNELTAAEGDAANVAAWKDQSSEPSWERTASAAKRLLNAWQPDC